MVKSLSDLDHPAPIAPELPAYQRLFRRGPPLPDRRSVFGRASLTVNARPLSSLPLNPSIARCASASTFISTKANPLCCPVSRSVAIVTRPTVPNSSNIARIAPSDALKLRLPTKILFILTSLCEINESEQDRTSDQT